MPSHMKQTETQEPERKSRLWIIPVVIVSLLAAVYLGGVVAFNMVFMPGTLLDGQDVSLRTVEEVADEKTAGFADYETHVTGNGVDLVVSAADVDLAYDGEAYARDAISQINAWAWPVEVARARALSAEARVTYDRNALAALIQPFVDAAAQTATDLGGASVTYHAETGSFGFDPSIVAQYLNVDAAVDAVAEGFSERADSVVLGADELVEGGGAAQEAVAAANAYLGAAGTTLALNGQTALEITADQIAGWVVVGDDLSVSLNEEAVGQWISENVGALDTSGRERTYTRPDGKQVSVSGGSYGWVTDEATCTTTLLDSLRTGASAALETPLKQSAQTMPDEGGRDWGNRYIDIDLSEQYVRMYGDSGSLIWESACVTGDHSEGYDTPTGVNVVNSNKGLNHTLRGLDYNKDGEPDYISHVTYWIPFVGNLVALHDADWRGSFGGTIYQYNGSHGCVNLPVSKAAELYDLAQIGDVVVVHY